MRAECIHEPTLRRLPLYHAVLVGAGHLGASLMQYDRFERFGLAISAGFDLDPRRVGVSIAGKPVLATDRLGSYVLERGIVLGILTVSAEAAQEATDRLGGIEEQIVQFDR